MGTHPIFESDFDCLTEPMTDEGTKIRWAPLESNPDVFNGYLGKLGVHANWQFNDIFGFDPELPCMIPQPCVAFILLFPITDKTEQFRADEEARLASEERAPNVVWMKQTIGNACGTVGIIHALLNSPQVTMGQESIIGALLEGNAEIASLHARTSQAETNQTQANESTKVRDHFVALVSVDNVLYELDGRKKRPISHGPTTPDSFCLDAAAVCKKFISLDPDDTNFAAVALSNMS